MVDTRKELTKSDAKNENYEKPPTQIAGVSGIDGHGSMGASPTQSIPVAPNLPYIDWRKLVKLPAFEMFVLEQSERTGSSASDWVSARRIAIGDNVFYDQYAVWHKNKGLWVSETPTGELIEGN